MDIEYFSENKYNQDYIPTDLRLDPRAYQINLHNTTLRCPAYTCLLDNNITDGLSGSKILEDVTTFLVVNNSMLLQMVPGFTM